MARTAQVAAIILSLVAACCAPLPVARGQEPGASKVPLHSRIDTLVEAAAIGPLAPICSDSDFVRRVYLDLTGIIPTAKQARDFVADTSPNKRETLIDELLASPAFLRHMTITLDVILMERKPEKVVKQPEWETYLFQSLASDKPLDQLFRELIASDGVELEPRPAARFLLDRDAEPNLLTRDIGRIAFGMDLQCCQCHDHPLIDDYYQADYYGLFAFLHRTTLYTDAKTKQISLTEKADGEAAFKSVFTGDSSDKALPRLPKGAVLYVEPTFAKGDEYKVKPDKTVRGIPKFSRREELAKMVPASREFSRNLANRLWAHLFGRGLVHPLDFHYAANPPSNPRLLTLLSDELTAQKFGLKPFLRDLSLSRTYQRSCDAPRADTINLSDLAARLARLETEKVACEAEIASLTTALTAAKSAFKAARDRDAQIAAELPKLEAAVAAAQMEHEHAVAQTRTAEQSLARLREQVQLVGESAAKLAEVATSLAGDPLVAAALNKVTALADELNSATQAAEKTLRQTTGDADATSKRVAVAKSKVVAAKAARLSPEKLRGLESAQLTANHRLADGNYRIAEVAAQIARTKNILDHAQLATTDPAKAAALWTTIVDQWTIAGQVAPLKPLTPEQFAASGLQSTGMFEAQLAAAAAKADKSPVKALGAAQQVANNFKANFVVGSISHLVTQARSASNGPNAQDMLRLREQALQLELLSQLRGTFNEFVRQYGGLPGEEFQATVNQALFFGNGSIIDTWLKPSGENLLARLSKIDDPAQLADELCWSVFSRPATDGDRQAVHSHLKGRSDKSEAIGEIVWALLSSTEYRFNH